MVTPTERPSADGTSPHGHHVFRFGHLVVQPLQYRGHAVGYRTQHHDHVRLARRVARHLEAETRHVITRRPQGHELYGATARAESERPKRIAAAPVDQVVQRAQYDTRPVAVQFLDHAQQVIVILEIARLHILYLGQPVFHFHSNAPFLQA